MGQLREALQEEGLSTAGLKAELVERLHELVQTLAEQPAESPSDPSTVDDILQQSSHADSSARVPQQSAQQETQSPALPAQLHPTAAVDDVNSVRSAAATHGVDEPAESFQEADSSTGKATQHEAETVISIEVQHEPASQDVLESKQADFEAAAALVEQDSAPGGRPLARSLDAPDQAAIKTGADATHAHLRNGL